MAEEPTIFEQATDPQPAENEAEDLNFTVPKEYKEYFEKYVGEGKKYGNVGELAKAYANADRHIVDLTSDVTKVKDERNSLKELLMTSLIEEPKILDANDQITPKPNDDPPAKLPVVETPSADDKSVDISKLVDEALTQREADNVRKANAQATEKVMLERFENREAAIKAVQDKANELNLTPQYLANLAFDSPAAYFGLMGIDPDTKPRSTETPASRSDVNAQQLAKTSPHVKEGTYAYYREIRRTNPSKFRSEEVQTRMMKDAETNPNFYS